ncbi:hypothetical protein GCM10011387_24820 [Pedobacter quisquiliarum]|jgi:hypothetical protein|uniref:Uncharacterized protein n=1 Tax=Pedobacter quisquiliarum TaxID=1834438 RepID=A0A916XGI4_9SPHI|nr:hypothetical protein [Pedobacter quisquiliarum]GGC70414.1 hypothetical protein GCM10011387_24820 [Pedobacter quisquiliarum]
MLKIKFLSLLLFIAFSSTAFSQKLDINNFIVKESLLKNSKLAIIAADSLENPLEQINGIYTFTVSGFSQSLRFNDGVAIVPLQLERSAFVYIKHINDSGTHSKLVYVYKKEGSLSPYTVNSMWLVIIPLIIVVIVFLFRKLLVLGIIIFLILLYFNHSNGLGIGTFFETIFDALKRLF